MLFWPRPSERLSLVDFVGFTARGLAEGRGGSARRRRRRSGTQSTGIWVEGRSRCSTIRSNPFQLPLLPNEPGPTWQGAPPRNWATPERRRPTWAARSRRTAAWMHRRSERSRRAGGDVTARLGGRSISFKKPKHFSHPSQISPSRGGYMT